MPSQNIQEGSIISRWNLPSMSERELKNISCSNIELVLSANPVKDNPVNALEPIGDTMCSYSSEMSSLERKLFALNGWQKRTGKNTGTPMALRKEKRLQNHVRIN